MTMFFYEKGKPFKFPNALAFHFDPAEIVDERETKWTPQDVPQSIPQLADGTAQVRKVKFTLHFTDFALGRSKPLPAAAVSTQKSLMWIRGNSQGNPVRKDPPVLVFTGLKREVRDGSGGVLFEGVFTSSTITSKIHAGPLVLARKQLLAFPNETVENDIVQATIDIEMSEFYDPVATTPETLLEAFKFGVTEATRSNGGQ